MELCTSGCARNRNRMVIKVRIEKLKGTTDARLVKASDMTLVLVYLSFIISMDVIEGAARGGKKRKPNFREDEILCLIEGIANEKVVIMTKLQSSLTNKKKKEVWRDITAKVNAFGVALRTRG